MLGESKFFEIGEGRQDFILRQVRDSVGDAGGGQIAKQGRHLAALRFGDIRPNRKVDAPSIRRAVHGAECLQRLQDQVYEASRDLTRLGGNTDAMGRLQTELDDVRDEIAYLKVKLRKEGRVNRAEFNDVQRRVQDLRSRARADMRGSDNTGGWRTNTDQPGTTGSRSPGTGTGVYGGVGEIGRAHV